MAKRCNPLRSVVYNCEGTNYPNSLLKLHGYGNLSYNGWMKTFITKARYTVDEPFEVLDFWHYKALPAVVIQVLLGPRETVPEWD